MNTFIVHINGRRMPHGMFEIEPKRGGSGDFCQFRVSDDEMNRQDVGQIRTIWVDEFRGGRLVAKYDYEFPEEKDSDYKKPTTWSKDEEKVGMTYRCLRMNSDFNI